MSLRNVSVLGTALALAALLAGPSQIDATPVSHDAWATDPPEVLVVSDNPRPVEIYAFDSEGEAHKLAEVEAGTRSVTLPSRFARDGDEYRLGLRAERITPAGIGVKASPLPLVKTSAIDVNSDETVKILVTPDLDESLVAVVEG